MTKIMIVDDSLRARHALKALMSQQMGIETITEASNGQEAIQNIKRQTPDIVFMDICMPVMDGLEATKAVKTGWPQVKVVILTIYPDYQKDALSAGADAFLIKGFTLDELTSVMLSFQRRKTGNSLPEFTLPFIPIPPQI